MIITGHGIGSTDANPKPALPAETIGPGKLALPAVPFKRPRQRYGIPLPRWSAAQPYAKITNFPARLYKQKHP